MNILNFTTIWTILYTAVQSSDFNFHVNQLEIAKMQSHQLMELGNIVKLQSKQIADLTTKVKQQQRDIDKLVKESDNVNIDKPDFVSDDTIGEDYGDEIIGPEDETPIISGKVEEEGSHKAGPCTLSIITIDRRLRAIDAQIPPVAFHAYISRHRNIPKGDPIIFDKVITNVGNAYNKNSGWFITTFKGVYVFNSLICPNNLNLTSVYLFKNRDLSEIVFGQTQLFYQNLCSSKTVLLSLDVSDVVTIRSNSTIPQGALIGHMSSTFSGWKIADLK